jgi:hypothetical protein
MKTETAQIDEGNLPALDGTLAPFKGGGSDLI